MNHNQNKGGSSIPGNSAKFNSAAPPFPSSSLKPNTTTSTSSTSSSSSSFNRFQSLHNHMQHQHVPPHHHQQQPQQQSLHSISSNIERVSNSLSSLPQQPNQPNGTLEISFQHFSELLILLQNTQLQIKKLVQYQEQTYQWNMKHHENMKKVIKSFNNLNAIMKQKYQSPDSSIDISNNNNNNNASSTSVISTTTNKSENTIAGDKKPSKGNNIVYYEKNQQSKDLDITYHQRIMDCYRDNDPYSQDLQALVENIDYNLFMELKEKSIKIILPIILLWMKETNNTKISLSLIILYMTFEKYPAMFEKKKYRELISQFGTSLQHLEESHIIDDLSNMDLFPFTFTEYNSLKSALNQSHHQQQDQQQQQSIL
ncbi:hypothetical protein DFA_07908 [Cavenderia fasciculata]|uniref:Uncharacterized protein n=1 Tax=Cavenderia fasciculata TaxID=261658 RepID=F4Q413_CACFS|nr:uncharacterized protein DFA_07908 [Cavenderia fasciculata]EGG16927.1 hypothetical protein DFA_07908 [Cavenderia fasciculata]|eukprot:XP_004355401.1 hypothetical protein DFA_07908 [Cavenderia fasciculata]